MRALVVLLVVLNVGIAAWWLSKPAAVAAPEPVMPDGVPRLVLLAESAPGARVAGGSAAAGSDAATPGAVAGDASAAPAGDNPAAEAATTPAIGTTGSSGSAPGGSDAAATDADAAASDATAAAPAPDSPRCFTAGPFTDPAARDAARTALAANGATAITARETTTAARGWRVAIAPLADRPAAEAVADRIRAAGIDDYMIVPAGSADANGIALGRYGSERAARARESALREAGFAAATAQPIGDAATRHWLDLRAGPGIEPAAAGIALAPRDCGSA